jgi:hypothetical protein
MIAVFPCASVSTAKHNGRLSIWVDSQVMNFSLNCSATAAMSMIPNFTGGKIWLHIVVLHICQIHTVMLDGNFQKSVIHKMQICFG